MKRCNNFSNQKFEFLLKVVFLFIFQALVRAGMTSSSIPLPANNFTYANTTWTNSTIVTDAVLSPTDINDHIPSDLLPDVIKSNLTNYNITKDSNLTHHRVSSFQSYSLRNNTYLLDSYEIHSFENYCASPDQTTNSSSCRYIIFNTTLMDPENIPVATGILIGTDNGTWTKEPNANQFYRGNQTDGIILSMFIVNATFEDNNSLLNCSVTPINPRIAFQAMSFSSNITKTSPGSNFNRSSSAPLRWQRTSAKSVITPLAGNQNPSNCKALCGTPEDYTYNYNDIAITVEYCGKGTWGITNDDDVCGEIEGTFTLLDINYDVEAQTIVNPSLEIPGLDGFTCDNCYAYIGATAGFIVNVYSHYVFRDEWKWHTWVEYTALWVEGQAKAGFELSWDNPSFSSTLDATILTGSYTDPINVEEIFDVSFQGILGIELQGDFTAESVGKCSAGIDYSATLGAFYQEMTFETNDDYIIDDKNLQDDSGQDGWQLFQPVQNKWQPPSCVADNFEGVDIDAEVVLKTTINTKLVGAKFPYDCLSAILTTNLHPTLVMEASIDSTQNDETVYDIYAEFDMSFNFGVNKIQFDADDLGTYTLIQDYMSDYFWIGPTVEYDYTVDAYSSGKVTWQYIDSWDTRRRQQRSLLHPLFMNVDQKDNDDLQWSIKDNQIHTKAKHELSIQDCSNIDTSTLVTLETKHFFRTAGDFDNFKQALLNITKPESNQYFIVNGKNIDPNNLCSVAIETSSYKSPNIVDADNTISTTPKDNDDSTVNFQNYPFAHSTSGIIVFCFIAAMFSALITVGAIKIYQNSHGKSKQREPELLVQSHNPDVENPINSVISN